MAREPQFVEARSAEKAFQLVETQFKQHADAITKLQRTVAEMSYDKQLQDYKAAMHENFRQAQSYSNVVIGIGYAGFFALWSMVRPDITVQAHAAAALLVGFSLVVFVAWEVYQMTTMALTSKRIEVRMQSSEGFMAAEIDAIGNGLQVRLAKCWPVVLAFTVIPAGIGASLLLYGIGRKLVGVLTGG